MEVRATVTLRRLAVGRIVDVDPADPYVRMLLDSGMLVPTGDAAAAEPEPQNPAAREETASIDESASEQPPDAVVDSRP